MLCTPGSRRRSPGGQISPLTPDQRPLTEMYETGGNSARDCENWVTMARKAVIPIVMRSAMDEGPNQKVVNVIRTIIRLGVKTEANLFAILRLMWKSMTRTEKFSAHKWTKDEGECLVTGANNRRSHQKSH